MDPQARTTRLSLRYLLGLAVGTLVLATSLAFAGNIWVVRSAAPYVLTDLRSLPVNDVGLLLGTSPYTRRGNESAIFQHRVEAAARLYHAGKIRHVIASGANPDATYNEPRKMYQALIALGVSPNAITMDFAGFRTLDSVVRAGAIFGQHRLTIISQHLHDYRAVFIARHQGIDAVAYAAPEDKARQKRRQHIREFFARNRAILDLFLLPTEPRFLGEPVRLELSPQGDSFYGPKPAPTPASE